MRRRVLNVLALALAAAVVLLRRPVADLVGESPARRRSHPILRAAMTIVGAVVLAFVVLAACSLASHGYLPVLAASACILALALRARGRANR